jgi:hypothetical protein
MQFRRSQRARLLPAVALVTIVISVFSLSTNINPGGVIALCVIFLFYWSVMAFIYWLCRIVIDDESIQLFGYFGRPRVIRKGEALTCQYRRFRANGRASLDVAFLIIRDNRSCEIPVWRYGWGPRRRELFARLSQWLDESPCAVDDQAREMLAKAA